jgi:hypothetical protein
MTEPEVLVATNDAALQGLVGNDPRKVALLRECVRQWVRKPVGGTPPAALSHYQQYAFRVSCRYLIDASKARTDKMTSRFLPLGWAETYRHKHYKTL